jgi:hypothetical protein
VTDGNSKLTEQQLKEVLQLSQQLRNGAYALNKFSYADSNEVYDRNMKKSKSMEMDEKDMSTLESVTVPKRYSSNDFQRSIRRWMENTGEGRQLDVRHSLQDSLVSIKDSIVAYLPLLAKESGVNPMELANELDRVVGDGYPKEYHDALSGIPQPVPMGAGIEFGTVGQHVADMCKQIANGRGIELDDSDGIDFSHEIKTAKRDVKISGMVSF